MCEHLERKIEFVKLWLQQKEYIVKKQGYNIDILSDTEQWFSMEIGYNLKAFVVDINLPDFAPYYSISMEIYDLEKDEPLRKVWHDTVETDIEEFEQEFERFFTLFTKEIF